MSTGFFGKIPATGDFISWNLPRVFIERWDRWMSMELRDRPETDPINTQVWRFTIQANIFGNQPCSGAWRMSQDRVGRCYPIAVIRIGNPPDSSAPWFDAVARLVKGCVDDFWPPSRLQQEIEELPAAGPGAPFDRIAFWTHDGEARELVFADIYDLADNGLVALRQAPNSAEM